MPLPDSILLSVGTPISWQSSGGTYSITLTSLPNDAGWQGGKGDLGIYWSRQYNVLFEAKPTSAPTDGNMYELFWAQSTNSVPGSDNPGNLSGVNGTVVAPDQIKRQLTYIGPLILSNSLGAVVQRVRHDFFPLTRYGFPVVVNKSGIALSSSAIDHKIILTPALEGIIE